MTSTHTISARASGGAAYFTAAMEDATGQHNHIQSGQNHDLTGILTLLRVRESLRRL